MRLLQTTARSLALTVPGAHGVLYYFKVVKDFTPHLGEAQCICWRDRTAPHQKSGRVLECVNNNLLTWELHWKSYLQKSKDSSEM